jgi:hypothetical protein
MTSQVLSRQQAGSGQYRRSKRAPLWYALAGIILFCAYLRLSSTYAENSDMANVLLMGWDLLHGNPLLHGWRMSDVSFYPTELVQYALLESVLGLRMSTAHVAAAMTYTLVVLLVVLVARGTASGKQAAVRTVIAGGIMIAPQLSAGVYAVDLAVGHIGTSVPLLLCWLLLDRAGPRWWVPVLTTAGLAWVLVADPVVEITGIAPLALVAGVRLALGLARRRPDWYDGALVAAALAAYALAMAVQAGLRALGGYALSPLPVQLRTPAELPAALPALWRVLDLFGADFNAMHPGVALALALAHLASVVLALAGLAQALRRRGGATLVDRVLAAGIMLNLLLYLGTLASTQGAHEIAVVLPYAAVLAGRMLAGPLLARAVPAARGLAAAGALLLCGYLAGLGYELTAPASPPADASLASWLLAHDLRSGIAGYWDSSSVTVDTGGQVRVRAVSGSLAPYWWMTDTTRYDPARDSANFMILQRPSSAALALLRRRLGPVDRSYRVDGCTVLVWQRNILAGLTATAPR